VRAPGAAGACTISTLLVDDSEVFRKSLRRLLTKHFPTMKIDEAATGEAALQQGREHELVFMDIRLPDASGLELARRFKTEHPATAVCVVTQFDMPEYREAASRSGARGFMLKDGLTEQALIGMVRSVLDDLKD
jgi:DNA-binding NarL/FixJ family response regulator